MKILTVYCGVVVTSVSIILLVYLIILTKRSFVSNTSIEVKIIRNKQIISVSNTSSVNNKESEDATNSKKKRKYHVPKFMLELYEANKMKTFNYTRPDVVRSLLPKHAGPYFTNEILEDLSDNHLLIFDLPTSNDDEEFLGAELKILTLVEINSHALSGVERVLKLSVYDDTSKMIIYRRESHIYHMNNTWLSFNLTKPVIDILNTNCEVKYLKILITVISSLEYKSSDNNLQLSLMPVADNFEHDYPVLLLSYLSVDNDNDSKREEALSNELTGKRTKRNVEDDYEEEMNKLWNNEAERKMQLRKLKKFRNLCKKKPLYIDFAEIKYDDWIVQPSGYEAYQCQGRCFYPVAEHLDPTKHAIVQALLHSVAPSKVSRSCCVPTKLTSISILYVDESGVLTYRYAYKDMVVVECGCR